jgi:hypothetical protein
MRVHNPLLLGLISWNTGESGSFPVGDSSVDDVLPNAESTDWIRVCLSTIMMEQLYYACSYWPSS